jgi:hypothetical protein
MELGCVSVSHASDGPPQWWHNLVAQETSQLPAIAAQPSRTNAPSSAERRRRSIRGDLASGRRPGPVDFPIFRPNPRWETSGQARRVQPRPAAQARRIFRSPAHARRPGRQSRMRLARPPSRELAVARRHRNRLPAPRSLRPIRLPGRPYPGELPLPDSPCQHHRSQG